jgi:tetratricopeptide (TPR) repeat protein
MGQQQLGFMPPSEATPRARAAALKAVELDGGLAEAHYVLALLYTWADWNWLAAEGEFKRAIAINPGFPDAHAYYSHYLNIMRRPDEAMAEARLALELDPFNALFRTIHGIDLMFAREYDAAIAEFNAVLVTEPASPPALFNLLAAHHHRREYRQALDALRRVASAVGYSEVTNLLDQAPAGANYGTTMRKAADALVARSRRTFVPPMDVATFYAFAGDKERCLEWLERAYQVRDPNLPYVGVPDFDLVRSDPRFQDLVQRMGLPM